MEILQKDFSLKHVFSYDSYMDLVVSLSEKGKTTGESTPERIEATKLNAHRMKRIEKQVSIRQDLQELIIEIRARWKWIILAEPWCGDGAQCIPVISKMAAFNPNIELILVLRDENPALMNKYLTNGSRSIPKLICIDRDSGKEIGTWGPRPQRISQMAVDLKKNNPGVSHSEFVTNLHLWYARDKGSSVQEDFIKLIPSWSKVIPR